MSLLKSDRQWMAGIAADGVVTVGDPRLRAGSEARSAPADVVDLLQDMTVRLRALNGAGLAAPQIGSNARAVVVEVRRTDVFPDRPTSPLIQMINPVIVRCSEQAEEDWEGCFSVPGFMGVVPRARSISVRYTTPAGDEREDDVEGYLARVVQHELDHLDGIEFVRRMSSMDSFTTVANWMEFHRNPR